MRYTTILVLVLFSAVTEARVLDCNVTLINGSKPQKISSVFIDPDKMLMEIWRGSETQIVLAEHDVYVIDAPAISYDRTSDCKYSKSTRTTGTTSHTFDCGADVKTKIVVDLDQAHGAGSFKSATTVPGTPSADFGYNFEFADCRAK